MRALQITELEGPDAEQFRSSLANLERNMRGLQESVMRVRMLPISFVFSRFPRMARDLAQRLGVESEFLTSNVGVQGFLGSTLRIRVYKTATSSAIESMLPTCPLFPRWVIRRQWARIRVARSRHSWTQSPSVGMGRHLLLDKSLQNG